MSRLFQTPRRSPWRYALLPLTALATAVLAPASVASRLPDPVASHFTGEVPDSASSLAMVVGVPVAIGLVVILGWQLMSRAFTLPALVHAVAATATTAYAFTVLGLEWFAVALSNLDAADWTTARTVPWAGAALGATAVVGVVVGATAGFALAWADTSPIPAAPPAGVEGPSGAWSGAAGSAPTEVWIGYAVNRGLAAGCLLGAALVSAYAVIDHNPLWLVVAVTILAATALTRLVVTFDGRTLTVRTGLPVNLASVPLVDIEVATGVAVQPFRWGGWGWRVRPGGEAFIVRAGDGLLVARRSGRELLMSVGDAQTGADLITAAQRALAQEQRKP